MEGVKGGAGVTDRARREGRAEVVKGAGRGGRMGTERDGGGEVKE